MPANMGFGSPVVKSPSVLERIQNGLLGPSESYGGLLSDEDQKQARRQAMMATAAQLMSAGGYSQTPVTLGQAIGPALLAGQQTQQAAGQDMLQAMLLKTKLSPAPQDTDTNSIREYQFAKKEGFEGSYKDWITAGGQTSRPSSVQEWEFYNGLLEEDKKNGTNRAGLYLEMKRNPNFSVQKINEVPTSVLQSVAGGVKTAPLSDLQTTASAAETVKQAEGRGAKVGGMEGEITGTIEKKGAEAVAGGNILDIADPLIDVATGSTAGNAVDAVTSFFGHATDGAQAAAQLQVLQAGLMMNQPRMEGPQGEKDVELYQKAAGQIGDPKVPKDIKKAAVKTIRQLQQKYKDRADAVTKQPGKPSGQGPKQADKVVDWNSL